MQPKVLFSIAAALLIGFTQFQLPVLDFAGEVSDQPISDDLADFAWLEGTWHAEAFGAIIEETWLPAMGNSVQAVFRAVAEDSLQFSEFIQVTSSKKGTIMRFNHFNPDFSTWEGDGPPMELILTTRSDDTLVFEAINDSSPSEIIYKLVDGEMHVSVSGLEEMIVFRRTR